MDAPNRSSPQKAKPGRADKLKTSGKLLNDVGTPAKSSRKAAQTSVHVRMAVPIKEKMSSKQGVLAADTASSKEQQEPRRSKSTPVTSASLHPLPPRSTPLVTPAPRQQSGPSRLSSAPTPKQAPSSSPSSSILVKQQTTSTPSSSSSSSSSLPKHPHPSTSLVTHRMLSESPGQTHRSLPVQAPLLKKAASVPQTASSDNSRQKLVDRANKARLYLLRQTGPNRFLIGGDAAESRFHVTIGPQSCTCNKLHCVHLLFVMLRMFKVSQSNPILWQKTLLNYETETLLRQFQARVSQRSTPKKSGMKKFDFASHDGGVPELNLDKASLSDRKSIEPTPAKDSTSTSVLEESSELVFEGCESDGSGGEVEEEEEEEVICPICLNELDEGEDLLVCAGCHNQLHQHCMDIWAGEQRMKGEAVRCPVCRTLWPPPTGTTPGPSAMPVSVPVAREEDSGGGRALHVSTASPSSQNLSTEKLQLIESLKEIFGSNPAIVEGLFSVDWKSREAALAFLSRESISLLLPQLGAQYQPSPTTTATAAGLTASVRAVQTACMEVVTIACNDSVLKVFLAALALLKVLISYSVCHSCEEAGELALLLLPVTEVLLTRCADAQRRVKECCISTLCSLCLGQEGPLSLGSACGVQAPYSISSVPSILHTALQGKDDATHTWHWWAGRLYFFDNIMTRFTVEYLMTHCAIAPATSASIEPTSGCPAQTAKCDRGQGDHGALSNALNSQVVRKNLLMQIWYFAAAATHVLHLTLTKVARRVIIRAARVLKDDPLSPEVVRDVVACCNRSSAEGLLERIMHEWQDPTTPTTQEKLRQSRLRETKLHGSNAIKSKDGLKPTNSCAAQDDSGGSEDSFRSALSQLDARGAAAAGGDGLDESSSTSTSLDSRSDDSKSASQPHTESSVYKRQTTADSAFGSELDGSLENTRFYPCKRNIEEEEAEAEARVRSMLPAQAPHPSLFGLSPPSPQVLIHVQCSGKGNEEIDAASTNSQEYIEGTHWVKGKIIGTGAFCSCYLARDIHNGTMFAVKQVSYVRNTAEQEQQELQRLKEEIAMLGKINHPNVVRCLGATQHLGHINIFIEWMAGGCLEQLLHDFGKFKEAVIVNYTRQVIHGIVYLHENGIIHRDLKGGNVLVDSTGRRVRIADFGAAARLATHTTDPGEFQDMEGTVAFMAPEVVRGGSGDGTSMGYGRKCDVWSIGCVIIQMSTGKPPWVGNFNVQNKYQLIFKIGQATSHPPLPDFKDPALKDLTLRCLEIKPEERPTSSELLKHPLFTSVE